MRSEGIYYKFFLPDERGNDVTWELHWVSSDRLLIIIDGVSVQFTHEGWRNLKGHIDTLRHAQLEGEEEKDEE